MDYTIVTMLQVMRTIVIMLQVMRTIIIFENSLKK